MRIICASVLSILLVATSMIMSGAVASAQPRAQAATVTPYEECGVAVPGSHSCITGRVITTQVETPSGGLNVTLVDNGRFEVVNQETSCTTTGSFHDGATAHLAFEGEHVVILNRTRTTGKTRCDDWESYSQCLLGTRVFTLVRPGYVRFTVDYRTRCDPL